MATGRDLTMLLVGDVFVCREDPFSIFSGVAPVLRSGDITFGNLEAPASDRGALIMGKSVAGIGFRSPPGTVPALVEAGFHVVGLANNHTMDYGAEAVLDTLERLDAAGIARCGAGRDLDEARRPAIVEREGCRVAFLSCSSVYEPGLFPAGPNRPGIATVRVHTAYQAPPRVFEQPGSPPIIVTMPDPVETKALLEDIRRAREAADVVVVSWHWGISQSFKKLAGYQVELGHRAVEAGADLVIGHHPHFLQGIERYRDGLICYSLGNFTFDFESSDCGQESMILKCRISGGRLQRFSFIPVLLKDGMQPEVVTKEDARRVLDMVQQLSGEFGTKLTIEGDEVLIQ